MRLILAGYARSTGRLFSILGIVAAVSLLGFIIVWPLWYAAVHFPRLYTIFVIILTPAAWLLYILLKTPHTGITRRNRFLVSFVRKVLISILCIFILLVALFLFISGNIAPGIIMACIFLLVSGYFSYGRG